MKTHFHILKGNVGEKIVIHQHGVASCKHEHDGMWGYATTLKAAEKLQARYRQILNNYRERLQKGGK